MFGWSRLYAVCVLLATLWFAALVAPTVLASGVCAPAAVSYSSYSAYPAASYSYSAPAYVAPAVKTVYKTEKVYIPYAVKAQVSPDFYSSSQDFYRDKILIDAVAGKTAEALKIQEELLQLRNQVQQYQYQQQQWQQQFAPPPQQYQPPPQQYPPQQPPAPHMPRAPYNGHGGYQPPQQPYEQPQAPPRQQSRSSVPEGLHQVVSLSCLRCHGATATAQGGGLDLRDLEATPWEVRLLCHSEVCSGSMPRAGKALSPDEQSLFYEWAQAARANVARR